MINDPTPMNDTEAAAIAALSQPTAPEKLIDIAGREVLSYPNGDLMSLERYGKQPKRIRSTANLYEAKSFIEYVKAYKDNLTRVFGSCNEVQGSFRAVIDYGLATAPGFGEHTANLRLMTTPEWLRWVQNSGKQMTQEVFAEFIEDNINDITVPDGGTMLDMVTFLTGKKGATFKSGKSLGNGLIDFAYTETIEASTGRRDDKQQLPAEFELGIVPFIGAAAGVKVTARLRYRISDSGKLSFFYLLNQPHKVIGAAFEATRVEIEAALNLFVHLGDVQISSIPN